MRSRLLLAFLPFILLTPCFPAQDSGANGWQRVQGLGPHTRIRIKTDKESAICFLHFVEDQQLTCARSEAIDSPSLVFPRAEIQSIKLWRKALGPTVNVGYVDDIFPAQLIYQR